MCGEDCKFSVNKAATETSPGFHKYTAEQIKFSKLYKRFI